MSRPGDDTPRPPGGRRRVTPLRVLLVVLVAAGVVASGVEAWANAYSINRAAPGDCLGLLPPRYTNDSPRYERGDCDSAPFVVRDLRSTPKDCVEVPGALRAFSVSGTVLCIGEQKVDPLRAINDVQVGECIAGGGGELPQKASCAAPEHWRVLLVLRDVDDYDRETSENGYRSDPNICADARGTQQIFSWGFSTYGGSLPRPSSNGSAGGSTWDRVLCLGR